MTDKTFEQNVKVGDVVEIRCEEAQRINAAVQGGKEVSPHELAAAMEHTRMCEVCRQKLVSSPTLH